MCRAVGITKTTQRQNNIIFNFNPDNFTIDIDSIIKKYNNRVKVSPAKEPYITYRLENNDNVLNEIIGFLKV